MPEGLKSRIEAGGTPVTENWGANCEYGVLREILLGPSDNLQLLPTSSVSKKTLRRGTVFDNAVARAQHKEMIAAYEEANVTVHILPADENLPYQIFARDSSVMTPYGAIITQMSQYWRRGEYAPCIRFYLEKEIPIYDMVTAGSFEGGDFNCIEPGTLLLGFTDERSQKCAADQIKGWMEAEGWEVHLADIDPFYVHIDLMVVMLAEKLAAVCLETTDPHIVQWLKGKNIKIIPVPFTDTMALGCNVVSLGNERVLLPAASTLLKDACRAEGLQVYDPDVSMITITGGGVHCMCQPLRRDPI